MHGYEIEQAIRERHIRKWAPIGTSSIYSGLERLEKKGFAQSQLDASQGLPARRVFMITKNGESLLREGAKDFLRRGEYIYQDFSIGMVAYPYLDQTEILTLVKERTQQIKDMLADAETHRPGSGDDVPEHGVWLWKHTYALLDAELRWLESFTAFLEDKQGSQ